MYILAFETTGKNASVACIDEEGELICENSDGTYNHLQSLIPMTSSLLKKSGIAVRDISCVAASAGPGSFTGIRIGVTTARAFAQAAGIPCIAVPTLQTFVYNVEDYQGLVCPMLDARREQIYGGAYIWAEDKTDIKTVIPGGAYGADEYLELLPELGVCDIMFFGDGMQKASSVAKMALKLWNEGKQISYGGFTPMYMRKAEAERKLEAAQNG